MSQSETKSQKRTDTDSPKKKSTKSTTILSDVMYDLDKLIDTEKVAVHSIVVSFSTGCIQDNSVQYKKGKFDSIDVALKEIGKINNEWFNSEKRNVEWLTYHDGGRFDYYVEQRQYFLSVNVFGLDKEDLCKLHTQFKSYFELSDQDFKDDDNK